VCGTRRCVEGRKGQGHARYALEPFNPDSNIPQILQTQIYDIDPSNADVEGAPWGPTAANVPSKRWHGPPRCSLLDCRRRETRVWDGSARRISRRASSTRAWRAPADASPAVPAPNVCMYSVLPPSVGATHKKQKNNPSHAGRDTSESSRAATPAATALLAPSARAPQPLA